MKMVDYYANALGIYLFWISNKYSPAAACGLLAQADAESSLNPAAVGDKDHAFGLHQWHTDRAEEIKEGCGVDLKSLPSLADQLKAALWELTHTENFANAKIKAATTAYDAGYAAARYWERPGSTAQYALRGNKAEEWAVYFAKNPPKTPPSP